MPRSEKRKGILGNEYIVHFDDAGNEVGRSETSKSLFGEKITKRRDEHGNQVSTSHEQDTLFSGKRTITEKASGETLYTTKESSLFGADHRVTRDRNGNVVSRTYDHEGIFGNKYQETVPEKAPPEPEPLPQFQIHDFRNVNWPATLGLNFLRAYFGGITFCIVMMCLGDFTNTAAPIAFVIGYFSLFVPLSLILGFFGRALSWFRFPIIDRPITDIMGLFMIPGFLFVMLGDPLLFLLFKLRPHLSIVSNFRFLTFHLFILVSRH